MSLLLPDYSSSSDDEESARSPQKPNSVPALPLPPLVAAGAASTIENSVQPLAPPSKTQNKKTTTAKKKKKKKKTVRTALHLPPEIQRLLESGTHAVSDDDDDVSNSLKNDDSLLAKHKRAVAKRPRTEKGNTAATQSNTSLSFLPAPKHQLPEPAPAKSTESSVESSDSAAEQVSDPSTVPDDSVAPAATYNAAAYAQYYQQYTEYYQQQQGAEYYYPSATEEEEAPSSSKKARHRDRELERLLQTGQFGAIADKIVEVQAPAPDAWQAPPVEELRKTNANDVKVKASFWNSSAGTTVSTMKPSRLQRQKHQLNQLAFDAKARETELLDRKGTGLKTKRETHAKYGW